MRRRNLILSLGVILVLAAAACGEEEAAPEATATSPAPEATATSPAPAPTPTEEMMEEEMIEEEMMMEVVILETGEHPELGTILTCATTGRTLYLFFADERNKSNCSGDCAGFWPPLLTTGNPVAGEGVNPDLLGIIIRDDGSTQVTYNGRPLYYFSGDESPGDANGQGVADKWFTVSSQGQPVQPTVAADVVVALNDVFGLGQSGVAALTAVGNKTLVVIDITPGDPVDEPQPVHIHFSPCGTELGGVDYPLTFIVDGQSVTLLDVSLDSIRDGNHVINAHKSGPEAAVYTACGDIPTAAESLSITLDELNDSGQSGTATLVDQGSVTLVALAVTPGLPENDPQPVHIHFSPCGPELGGVDYPLTFIVEGQSVTLVDVTLDSIRDGNHVINAHKSGPEAAVYTACGAIPALEGVPEEEQTSTGGDNGGGGYSY